MAFELIGKYRFYQCESTDVKKVTDIDEGSLLFELDTSKKYRFNGTVWVLVYDETSPVATSSKSATNLITVDTTATGTQIVAANANRIRLIIQNQTSQPVLLSFNENTSITSYSLVLSGTSGTRTGDDGTYTTESWKESIKGLTEANSSVLSIFEEVV